MEVLLIAGSPDDVRFVKEAFREPDRSILVHIATDVVAALAILRNEGMPVDAPRPDLIAPDLNLIKINDREVLTLGKSDNARKLIRTFSLPTSQANVDIARQYCLPANSGLRKSLILNVIESLVQGIHDFWCKQPGGATQ